MCGIVGYIGQRQAQEVLFNSLAKLEYRGYDSCGVAIAGSPIKVYKDAVRVLELARSAPGLPGGLGIGHTRWATHGHPCQMNAHPHIDCSGKIAVVHNGVIRNYQKLKNQLIQEGHRFISETDTEVIPHLIEKYYQGNLEDALKKALIEMDGSYAVIALAEGERKLVFTRKDSPLIMGIGDQENFIASDVPAILEYTNRVIYLENGDLGVIDSLGIKISQNGKLVERKEQKILWAAEGAQKGGYEHFMLKEIHEQPRVIRDTITEYLAGTKGTFDYQTLKKNSSLLLLACGTSYHAALVGKYIGERLMGVPVKVEMCSEFNYYQNLLSTPVAIAITQSGETADTLKAMSRLKEMGSKVIAITNVTGSTASKMADYTLYIRAGPEISVAATKSFTAQLAALYWLALLNSNLETRLQNDLMLEFRRLPDKIQQVLSVEDIVAEHGARLANYEFVTFIGRGINYAIALEGALKLKEVSYIHSEAYAAGEIKHGPFALLSRDTPVVAIIGHDNSYDAMLTSIKEIKARGSPIIAIVQQGDDGVADIADYVIPVPRTSELFTPFVNTVVIQLLAYFTARKRGCPIDFPRNLAKSVTVE